MDDLGVSDKQVFDVINNCFTELNTQTESYTGDLFAILFTSGKTVERFIHKVGAELDDVNKSRMRVLVNWDERVSQNANFDMRSIINSHMVSIVTTAKVGMESIGAEKSNTKIG